jgi:hypothetical protein
MGALLVWQHMMGWTRMMMMIMIIGMIEAKVNLFVQKSLLAGYRLWYTGLISLAAVLGWARISVSFLLTRERALAVLWRGPSEGLVGAISSL